MHVGRRLVHLDLKGAPPKMAYLHQLLPCLKEWGATGVLIEYEDTFPYDQDLSILAGPSCYRREELQFLVDLCHKLKLEIVPLVQTFGHMEFVLKHQLFKDLREVYDFHNSLCPSKDESLTLVCRMLNQVLDFHSDIAYFHIGCDEVYQLGMCVDCQTRMRAESLNVQDLFLRHVRKVASHICQVRPSIRPIIWDDMLRGCSADAIKDYEVAELTDIMIWFYGGPPFPDVWSVYADVPVTRFWCASAFKGASGCKKIVPDITLHVENHKLWLAVLEDQCNRVPETEGFVFTGWQRYDHYAVLCELIPSSLPSLALCLCIIKNGGFSGDVHMTASESVGLGEPMPIVQYPRPVEIVEKWNFPGSEICVVAHWLANLEAKVDLFYLSESSKGWLSKFNLQRKFFNPAMVKHLYAQLKQMLIEFHEIRASIVNTFPLAYHESTIVEYIGQHVTPLVDKLRITESEILEISNPS